MGLDERPIDSWTRRGVYSHPLTPGVTVDFLASYLVVLFVGSASLIAALAAIDRHRDHQVTRDRRHPDTRGL